MWDGVPEMSEQVVTLVGDVRTGDAAGLRDQLRAGLDAGDLLIATGGLTSVDCAVVQVLVAARRSAVQLERDLQIDMPADGVLAATLDRLALTGALVG